MPNFTGTDGNDSFTGTADAEIINGGGGNDVLNGGDGNDTIDGGAGTDQSFGEGGDDTLVISVAPVGGERYDGGAGTDTLQFLSTAANFGTNASGPSYNGGLGNVTLSSIERLVFGSVAGSSMTLTLNAGQIGGGLSTTAEIAGGDGRDQLLILATVPGTYTLPAFTYSNWNHPTEALEQGDVTILLGAGNGNFTLNAATGHLGLQSLIGGNGHDTLNGSDGMEVLNGGAGVNTLNGGGGDDVLIAVNQFAANGSYSNLFFQNNVYNGGTGFDWLSVGGYVEFQGTLTSIEGINLQAGFSIVGGATQHEAELEVDWGAFDLIPADFNLRGTGVLSLRLGAGDVVDASGWVHTAGSDVFVQFFGSDEGGETVIGTSGNDRFSPSFGTGTFTGGLGADQFEAGEGQATVNDFSIVQGDRVDLQDMNITSWEQLQPFLSQDGNNVVFSRMYGGVAQTMTLLNVSIADLTADSFVFQGTDDPESDTRIGTESVDDLIGAAGNDQLEGLGGDDYLFAGDGDDTLIGGDGNDELFGGGGNDSLDGGAGHDLLDGGEGNDSMTGGAGDDIYIVGNGDIINENADEGIDEVRTSVDWGLFGYFENLTGTGTGDIFLGGSGLDNVITGNSGNNHIVGLGGDDTIDGGGGNDVAAFRLPGNSTGTLRVVEGEGGLLLVQLVQTDQSFETLFEVTVSGNGSATVTGVNSLSSLGTDTVTNVEDLHFFADTFPAPTPQGLFVNIPLAAYAPPVTNGAAHVGGSFAADIIDLAALYSGEPASTTLNANGNAGNDTLLGTEGNNFLSGDNGNNSLSGRGGNDGLRGGDGNDTINGGAGVDWADFALPGSTPGTLRFVEGANDELIVQLVQADGSSQDVFLVAPVEGGWTVTGLGIAANHGTDTVSSIESLNFFIDVWPAPHAPGQYLNMPLAPIVPAVVNGSAHVGGSVADDVIDLQTLYPDSAGTAQLNANGGIGDDAISGTNLGNFIDGGTGNDTLNGRGGNDTLVGGAGNDTLDGGANQDQAQFVLPASLSGTWLLVKNGDGSFSAMLTRGGVQEEAFRLTHNAGTWTVEGRNSAAFLGTDTLTNVETVGFFFDGPFNNATSLFIQLSPIVAQNGTQLGGIGDDVMDFSGFAGPVTVNANFGNDTVTGSNFNDTLNGGADDDTLIGGAGNDNLRGDAGNDQLFGGDGNDIMRGGAGIDSFDGGSTGESYNFNGFGDRISFFENTASQGVVVDLRTSVIANDGFGNVETATGIESLGGDTAFADTFHGSDGSNTFLANRGDFIYGHGGNDDLNLSSAASVTDGGDGDDLLTVSHVGGWLTPDTTGDGLAETVANATAGWTVNLATGTTTDGYGNVGTVANVENVSGSSLNDSLTGDGNANALAGGFGDDTLVGGGGNDILSGDDILDFVDGVVTVVPTLSPEFGGDDFLDGGAGNDLLIGGVGDDQLRGRDGDDTLQGGTGNDLLGGGAGVDSYDGGTGGEDLNDSGYGDRISFYERTATAAVVADLRDGTISNDGFGNVETMTGIEALGADTAFADTFHGNDGTNVLFANRGDNLYGHGGDDYFSLTSAAAIVDGGDGTDRLTINVDDGWLAPDTDSDGLADLMAAATAGWSVNLTTGVITDGYGNTGAISNVENVEGSQLNDVIIGTDGDNVLEGGTGNDTLRGGEGDDALYGNDGNDFLAQTLGGEAYISTYGNDLYDGGDGSDRVSLYTESGPGVTVDLNVTTAQDTGAAGTDTFIGIEHITATYGDDHLTGTADTNFFWAFGGNDTLIGNGGDDYFVVGRQDKVIDGGSGVDTVDMTDDAFEPYYTADGITVSLLLQGTAQAVGTGSWTLSGIENLGGNYGSDDLTGDGNANILAGLQGDDILRGGGGNDVLSGDGYFDWDFVNNSQLFYADPDLEGGNDTLEGGAGNDTLYGGGGNDVLRGQVGNDLNYGGSGNDLLIVGAGGDDLYDGGAGSDRVSFFADTFGAVTVDLTLTGPQNTGRGNATFVGVEHVTGDYGNDTLTGNDETNWFWTFAGTDSLYGNGGDDYFTVGYGTKVIDGGTGSDVLEISDTAYVPMYTIENGVTISLELQGQAQQTGIGSFTISNIENLTGDVGNDTFIGDANANILAGYSGDDTLRGGGGNDFLSGDGTFELNQVTGELFHNPTPGWIVGGDDTLEGGSGDDILVGGDGDDSIDGGAGSDVAGFHVGELPGTLSVIVVGDEKHVILTDGETVTHVATIFVADGVLMVRGEGPAASLGTDSVVRVESLRFLTDDTEVSVEIDTGVVADGLVAGATVFMDANSNGVWDEGEARTTTGADGSFSFLVPGTGPIIATGGTNTDTGLPNLVTLAAPEGSTVVNPLTTLVQAVVSESGGTLSAADASAQVAESLGLSDSIDLLNTDIYTQATGGDTAALEAQKAAAIIVTVLVAANDASAEGDVSGAVMQGLANLVIDAPEGGVSLSSEESITAVLSNALPAETVNAMAADLAVNAQAIDDAESSEVLSDAQAASLTTGNDLANTLQGGSSDDLLDGRGGNDTLHGSGGNDTLVGGAGIDALHGGDGDDLYVIETMVTVGDDGSYTFTDIDQVFEGENEGSDTVTINASHTLGANVENLVLTGGLNLSGFGNSLNNSIVGNAGNNFLQGYGGDDILDGGLGNDLMTGGDGNDTYIVDSANDTITPESPAVEGGNDTVIASVDYVLASGLENLTLTGAAIAGTGNFAANVIIGNALDNALSGDAGDDIVSGGAGNDSISGGFGADVLTGGAGADVLTGGAGLDRFNDTTAGLNGDTIVGLESGESIVFSDADLDSFTFSLSGNTLAYTGGSLTLQGGPAGTLVASAAAGGGVALTLTASTADARDDFNGDGRSDVMWRNDNGTFSVWAGAADGGFAAQALSNSTLSPDWQVVGSGDFNGDGRDDVLWRHSSGAFGQWSGLANGGFVSNPASDTVLSPSWQIASTGDFNGDGRDDILWRHESGITSVWAAQSNGGFATAPLSNSTIAASWHIVGTGDFNGDGRDDILWRNDNGATSVWAGEANGGFTAQALSNSTVASSWRIAGTGDFNGDGRDDILWHHDDGAFSVWAGQADGGFVASPNSNTFIQPSWHIEGTGDYNGDGRDDVLWRNDNGAFSVWHGGADGGFVAAANSNTIIPVSWEVQNPDLNII